jgi:hypothetical protein
LSYQERKGINLREGDAKERRIDVKEKIVVSVIGAGGKMGTLPAPCGDWPCAPGAER